MKHYFLPLLILLSSCAASQNTKVIDALVDEPNMTIETTSVKLNKTLQPALTVYVNGDKGSVEKAWVAKLEKECNCDLDRSKGFYQASGVVFPVVSLETLSVYTQIEEDEKGAKLNLLADFGGKFMSQADTPTEATKFKALINNFLKQFYVD
ncbi:MAG: hypothetical protein HKN32_04210, partial [Flavobacteriales bacterium]|nr:hypothetical protein [Flavobacteriales bacterium]